MNDLIRRNALLAEYDQQHEGEPGRARRLIEDAPAVDAVEVVRCCDCKFEGKEDDCPLLSIVSYTQLDDYCSFGERKENEEE